jgi:ribosomal protein S18 acetylase RimI-like enzyme
MIEVRKYTGYLGDLLNWDLDLDFWEDTRAIIEGYLVVPNELAKMSVYFAYDRNQIVGYIFGDGKCIHIAVDYRYRNRGLGKELVNISGFSNPYDIWQTEEARSFWQSTGYQVSKQLVTI